jgi:predicted hydrocarbon binding protein
MAFEFDRQNGVIKDKITEERCIIITQARMQEIFSRLSEIFQSGATVIIHEASKAAGKRFIEETIGKTKNDKELILKTAVQRFTDAGLGKIKVTEFNLEETEVKFRIWNNFFAEIRCGESAYCSCIEGFVSGMYDQVMHETPKIKETKCVRKGNPYCEWQITSK